MELVIFDMDGTILNTLDDLADSTNVILERAHFPARSRDEVRQFVGNGILKLIERAVPSNTDEATIQALFHQFNDYYKDHCSIKTCPYEGIVEAICQLRNEGVKIAVVSNKGDYAVQSLSLQYFPGLIDYAVGEREGISRKPAPDSVNEVLRYFQCPIDKAVYVGDSDVDIQTARNANLDCISITWGFRNKDFLIAHGAATLVSSPGELIEAIHHINK